jgi:ubiquinone/menaquinone biosynthesis C-methylase UbiE
VTAQTWHYGVVARWWAEFNHEAPEVEFLRPYVEAGQPTLDVACGTGRVLIPLLRDGFDADGTDISSDMLSLCRERAEHEGLAPNLYAQATHQLDLPRTYRTIVMCGSFGIGGNPDHDREALRRLYRHLEPGGLLIVDEEMPYADATAWSYWTKEGRRSLPESFEEPTWTRASDGTEYALASRVVDVDPLEQRLAMEMKGSMRRGGEVIEDEPRAIEITLYTAKHVEMLLESAGFHDVARRGEWTNAAPTAETRTVVFLARKPGA